MHDDIERSGQHLTGRQDQVLTQLGHVAYQSLRRDTMRLRI